MRRPTLIIRAFALTLLFCLTVPCLVACGETGHRIDPTAYLQTDITTSVCGELWGIAFEGELCHAGATSGETVLTLTAPAALAGIAVSRRAGTVEIALGKMRLPDAARTENGLGRLLLPLTAGQVLSLEESADGEGVFCAVIETAEGTYTVRTDAEGRPLRWECDGMRMACSDGADK